MNLQLRQGPAVTAYLHWGSSAGACRIHFQSDLCGWQVGVLGGGRSCQGCRLWAVGLGSSSVEGSPLDARASSQHGGYIFQE